MKLTIILLTSLVAAVALSSIGTAHTFFGGSWAGQKANMYASRVSFPVGSSYRTALGTIESRFRYEQPSQIYFDMFYDDPSVSLTNGHSETWFSADAQFDPAVAFNIVENGIIVSGDIVFYNGENYTTSTQKTAIEAYGGNRRPFETMALHEFCHVAGLGHEDDEYNIMGEDFTHITCNGSRYRSYIGEDAANGLVSLHGYFNGIVGEDLGVTLFKRTGQLPGGYSDHDKCLMFSPWGPLLPSTAFNGQRRYNVSPGETVDVEFTYENNGGSYQSGVALGFYISTNSYISKYDTRISSQTINLGRDNVYTGKRKVTIPTNLMVGRTLYLGVIIDDDSSLPHESSEDNNAAYHIIKIN